MAGRLNQSAPRRVNTQGTPVASITRRIRQLEEELRILRAIRDQSDAGFWDGHSISNGISQLQMFVGIVLFLIPFTLIITSQATVSDIIDGLTSGLGGRRH